jgi:hypothetical protein
MKNIAMRRIWSLYLERLFSERLGTRCCKIWDSLLSVFLELVGALPQRNPAFFFVCRNTVFRFFFLFFFLFFLPG